MTTLLIRNEIIARNPVSWDLPRFYDVEDSPLYKQAAVWVFDGLGTLAVGIPYSSLDDNSFESAGFIAEDVIRQAKEAFDIKRGDAP